MLPMNGRTTKLYLLLSSLLIVPFTSQSFDKNRSVSMEFQDVPTPIILQALADYQQLNLVTAANVNGNLSLKLIEVPWQQALATILRMGKLTMELEGNVMMVFAEQEAIEKRKQAAVTEQKAQQPLNNLTLALQHANAKEIAQSLSALRGTLLTQGGSIIVDKRTNTLLIRDTPESLNMLKPWLAEMDLPLQQVQLAAHIITISSENLRELGVRWGMSTDENTQKAFRINNFNVGLPLLTHTINAGFNVARINGRLLDLELSALEQENQVEIIASPRLITSHQQTASIKQGTDIPYTVANGARGTTSIEFKEAVLGMEVTPQILRNGKITLKLQISQNMPGRTIKRGENEALAIDKQEINTQVTINDGKTIVLGGIFQHKKNQRADKVPGLADVPLLGTLFKQNTSRKSRRELVIFITPTLIKS